MNIVHFRNGVWQVVRDWQVIDAAPILSDLLNEDAQWVSNYLDRRLPPYIRAQLLADGLRLPAGNREASPEPPSSQDRPRGERAMLFGRRRAK